jgi:YD repeat-containing protein
MSRVLTLSVVLGMVAAVAVAQETTTYTYDVHGRLVGASRTTGPNTTYAYDGGDSRTSRVTTGASSLMAAPEPTQEAEAAEASPDADPEPAEAPPEPDIAAQQD